MTHFLYRLRCICVDCYRCFSWLL